MSKERMRNEDGRGGDVIVQDSIVNGRPDLPIDRDPGRETNVAIDADDLGSHKDHTAAQQEEKPPTEKRNTL